MIKSKNYESLRGLAFKQGAVAFGVADCSKEKKNFNLSSSVTDGLDFAISIAVGLSRKILSEIDDKPTKLYFHHYRQANNTLDRIAFRLVGAIQEQGYEALPIPASQIIDWQNQTSHVSHKRIAQLSGVGWLGRNNLIIHPKYGAHIRLVTILTDMPLSIDTEFKENCGTCKECVKTCPAGAIKESAKEFDHMACFEKLKFFQKERYVPQYICGICVKACRGESQKSAI